MAVWGIDYRCIIDLEIALIKFYHHIILEDILWSRFESNLLCLSEVRRGYSKYVLQNGLTNFSFSSAGMRSAYIFLNIPCFSSCVASHFINLIHGNPRLLSGMISQNCLTICCLGGGPGGELMATVKSLELILKMFCYITKPVTVNATIIDIDPGWKEVSKQIIQNWWKCADFRFVKLNLSFKEADLTQPLSESIAALLKNSDIVTMVKFVSAVYGTKGRDKISEMLQEVIRHMKENGILFYLNCSRFSRMKDLNDVIAKSANMVTIYGPLHYDVYELSEPSKRVCYSLYSQFYGNESPTFHCQNHVMAWRKFET